MIVSYTLPRYHPFIFLQRYIYGCLFLLLALCQLLASGVVNAQAVALKHGFLHPPASAKPGVYWYFMDGNLSEAGITADLEAMKAAGISNVLFLEVNVGIPRGKVDFLSETWQRIFVHAVRESERLGIAITLGIGPGWSGSGGPWVKPAQSMRHLVASRINVSGNESAVLHLPVPAPRTPFFGEGVFTGGLRKQWTDYYEDIAVLAFPTPADSTTLTDIDEKALYYRAPFTSQRGVKPFLPMPDVFPAVAGIPREKVKDVSAWLQPDGTLNWKVPPGKWTIMRFGLRNNGAITRPAPTPGLGFEADKFDTTAIKAHLDHYIGALLRKLGKRNPAAEGGLKRLHMDSWEMGAQNWTANFREFFRKRRGYDPLPFYPVYAGRIIDNPQISERFLWDLRQTAQELVLENHAGYVKQYAHRQGLKLSIEPYDMNPTADLELGAIADVPMCEFWSKGMGFNSAFSCIEAVSIAHVNGQQQVPAEAFTAEQNEGWKQYPGSMKNQGDWAFAAGINQFVFHTFQSQMLNEALRPGMTMGPYGVHWDRHQTWWPLVGGYHDYLSRCQFVLQQGTSVADILYLTPEGAPHVFQPPASALSGDPVLPDRKGYNFDGCSPGQLYKATVQNGRIVFPGGASYRILVLPAVAAMTPQLLKKIQSLVNAGAVVTGVPPRYSPGLTGYPACDVMVRAIARQLWEPSSAIGRRIIRSTVPEGALYPYYDSTAAILQAMKVAPDLEAGTDIRYAHRRVGNTDVYFLSNKTSTTIRTTAVFRSHGGKPQLWDPMTGNMRALPEYTTPDNVRTAIPLQFNAGESYFIVFDREAAPRFSSPENFPASREILTLQGPWKVTFDPKWGGPGEVAFDTLQDWINRPEPGIRYYSGMAVYRKTFDLKALNSHATYLLQLGSVDNLASVTLNGKTLGTLWAAPWQIDITPALKEKNNQLEITVANRWPNRLIGDEQRPDDGIRNGQWPDWLLKNEPRNSGRFTFSTWKFYTKDSPLLPSGLHGPVVITN
ncbi:glycosyl hydrolase [Chitinophaga sp. 212800010-3]|uniref:glycosyl hydrolase n=1 Tax=unclassified Chitinophaga TaxID=2619133 RepID=UPI002DECAA82|nr:Glycosyl hydrolase [Chitinophaga sp. 212800010-3]